MIKQNDKKRKKKKKLKKEPVVKQNHKQQKNNHSYTPDGKTNKGRCSRVTETGKLH